jgi:acetyl-CoA synthetase
MRRSFRWPIPARFNMARACCDDWAAADPDRVALIDLSGDARDVWTFARLKDASDRLASAFAAQGIGSGDRVAVLLAQGAMVPVVHFAAMKLGAVVLPLFTLFGVDALAYRLADAGARAVVTDAENLDKVMALWPDLPDLRQVYVTGPAHAPVQSLEAAIAAARPLAAMADTLAEDPAVLIYTSGTTGAPKGVLHAHRFLIGHLPSMELTHEGFPRSEAVGWTPADWAWIGGLMDMAMPCLYYGVPLIARRLRRFDAAEALALMRDQGVTNVFLPPTALKMMRGAKVPAGLRLRSVSSGGESLGAEMLDWGRQTLNCPINELYGQTECNLVVSQAAGFMAVRPGTMGQALPGFDVAVIDADGTPVAPGVLGEIAVRRGAASMFLRYWNQPEKTAEKFRGDWMCTGDLGRCDDQGYFTYVARDDDIINSAGYRIGPSEIENCLMGDADVVLAACVGVPDPVRGEVIRAHVVLRAGATLDVDRLIRRVQTRISPHVAPRSVVQEQALPMTATGKIIRKSLRDHA